MLKHVYSNSHEIQHFLNMQGCFEGNWYTIMSNRFTIFRLLQPCITVQVKDILCVIRTHPGNTVRQCLFPALGPHAETSTDSLRTEVQWGLYRFVHFRDQKLQNARHSILQCSLVYRGRNSVVRTNVFISQTERKRWFDRGGKQVHTCQTWVTLSENIDTTSDRLGYGHHAQKVLEMLGLNSIIVTSFSLSRLNTISKIVLIMCSCE